MASRVLVLGANSGICHRICRIWASRGDHFVLVGRDGDQLNRIAEDLKARGAPSVSVEQCDLSDFDQARLDTWKSNGFDRLLLGYGSMLSQSEYDSDSGQLGQMLQTNFVSATQWLNGSAEYLAEQSGTMVVLGSVAGDRARKPNYSYGSAKAGLAFFCEGLRLAYESKGLNVVLAKPGPTRTRMTADMDRDGLLWSSAEQVASKICQAVDRGRPVVYAPGFWRWLMAVIRTIPWFVFRRMNF